MALFLEDSQKVTRRKAPVPLKDRQYYSAWYNALEKVMPKNNLKNLKSLASTKNYNKKGDDKLNGKEQNTSYVSVEDAKKRMQRMNPNDITQGGQKAYNFYKKTVERARSQAEVSPIEPPKPTASVKPSNVNITKQSIPTSKIKTENRQINESFNEEHPYFEYLDEYDANFVFNEFLENPSGKQNWGVLINPNMYAKALREFTQYGKLVKFPVRYIYQWIGIIMRNTAILKANTSIAGHSQWFPEEEFEDFVISYFNNSREVESVSSDEIKIELSPNDVIKLHDGEFSTLNEAVDKYGQTYLPWMSQDDVNRIVAQQDLARQKAKFEQIYGDIEEFIAEFNESSKQYGQIEIDYNTNKLYWVVDSMNFLDLIGFYDWMMMPDGSDAFSDFGIEPLERVLSEYDENLPPEKVLVIVNKALDVYHMRGDMASIFVVGGSKALNQIAEEIKKSGKKVYITEEQLIKLNDGKYNR